MHPLVKGKDEIACPRGLKEDGGGGSGERNRSAFHVASANWKIRTVNDELSNAGSVPRRSQDGPGENPWRNGFKYIRGPRPAIAIRLSITFHQRLQKMGVKYAKWTWRVQALKFLSLFFFFLSFYFFYSSFLHRSFRLSSIHGYFFTLEKWNFITLKWVIDLIHEISSFFSLRSFFHFRRSICFSTM